MRYILALTPPKEYETPYFQAAEKVFSSLCDGYMLAKTLIATKTSPKANLGMPDTTEATKARVILLPRSFRK